MRIERIGNATLYLADCMDVLPILDKVDAVITDPPYDEKTHSGHLSKVVNRQDLGFDKLLDFQKFIDICVEKASRWVIMTCATSHVLESMNREDFIRMGIWVKPNGAPQFTGDRPGTGWESVAIFHRKGRKKWNGGGHHAVWITNIESGQHPTQKPIFLFSKFIEQFTDNNNLILDPFMGSGTTGVAAIQMGRKFIGIEREESYFNIACERIEQATKQASLFEPVEVKKLVQQDLL